MDSLWEKYWQTREMNFNSFLGKKQATIALKNIIANGFKEKSIDEIKILDLGCGDGYTLKYIYEISKSQFGKMNLYGLDKSENIISEATLKYPNANYINEDLLENWAVELPKFDLIFSINTLHEVFSSTIHKEKDCISGKKIIEDIILKISELLTDNGYFLLFDGVEGDNISNEVSFKLNSDYAKEAFDVFCKEYKIFDFEIKSNNDNSYTLLNKYFTRFVTKLKWILSDLWQIEKNESYQYFTVAEFESALKRSNLNIVQKDLLISDIDFWKKNISIIGNENNFPWEHILIISKNTNNGK